MEVITTVLSGPVRRSWRSDTFLGTDAPPTSPFPGPRVRIGSGNVSRVVPRPTVTVVGFVGAVYPEGR